MASAPPLVATPPEIIRFEIAPRPAERYVALDALRGGAMFLGVCLHAAISYMPSRMPELIWGIFESETNTFFDVLFWWIHAFRLPLFFVLAGFFALLVLETKGTAGFLKHRAGRLLVPFLIGSVIFVPVGFYYVWACRIAAGDYYEPLLVFSAHPENIDALLGPMHLWFLEDLLILSLVLAACWRAPSWPARKRHRAAKLAPRPRPAWAALVLPFVLAVPPAVFLAFDPRPFVAHYNSFLPNPARLLYYGYFFAIGVWLYQERHRLRDTFAFPRAHLILSVPASAAMLWLLWNFLDDELTGPGLALFGGSVALTAWLSIFGFTGLALRLCPRESPALTYLADSAYWIYLCHMSLVGLLQLEFYWWDWPAAVKFTLVVVITLALGFMMYQTMVRYTFLGRCLNGPRERRVAPAKSA